MRAVISGFDCKRERGSCVSVHVAPQQQQALYFLGGASRASQHRGVGWRTQAKGLVETKSCLVRDGGKFFELPLYSSAADPYLRSRRRRGNCKFFCSVVKPTDVRRNEAPKIREGTSLHQNLEGHKRSMLEVPVTP